MTGTILSAQARPPHPTHSKRLDVQGLRAVAVLIVIADHLWGVPAGGYVGVDVFFVISGFMITGLLLRERERTGRISFADFYRRRARRLLPASLTVLAVTAVVGYAIFTTARFKELLTDTWWAVGFSENWRLIDKATDYQQADGPTSPLQHYWSLGVEEQFYFVWPVVMVLALGTAAALGMQGSRQRVGAAVVLAIVSAASLWWAFDQTDAVPQEAYFSTFTRVWELGVGALIAAAVPLLHRIPDAVRPVLAWSGLAGIAASVVLIDAESAFPAPWALLPVASSALVLIAGEGGDARVPVLSNPVSVYLGDVSYSLYLWHFPVIIYAEQLYDIDDPLVSLVVLALLFAVSIQGYHLLEDPIRRSNWLEPKAKRREKADRSRRPVFTRTYAAVAVSALVVTGGVSYTINDKLSPTEGDVVDVPPGVALPIPGVQPVPLPGPTQALQAQISEAVQARSWPELEPDVSAVIEAGFAYEQVRDCSVLSEPRPDSGCAFGSPGATRTAVIVGDSVAVSYVEALREVLTNHPEWRLITYATTGCTFTGVRTVQSSFEERCPPRKEDAVAAIQALQPDLVFVSNTYITRQERTADGGRARIEPEQWRVSTQAIVERFADVTGKVVFLTPPPGDVDLKACYNRASTPQDCLGPVTELWHDVASQEALIAQDVGGQVLDTRPLFCDPQARCPIFVGDSLIRPDQVHIAPSFAATLAPAFDALLVEAGIL